MINIKDEIDSIVSKAINAAVDLEAKVTDFAIEKVKTVLAVFEDNEPMLFKQVRKFNEMYAVGNHEYPRLPTIEEFEAFQRILAQEVKEGDDFIAEYKAALQESEGELSEKTTVSLLAKLTDWHLDVVIYNLTTPARWGLPIREGLNVIMQSNFSKLGADGKTIFDADGKIDKGPNYWKPEPALEKIIETARNLWLAHDD